MSSPLKGKTWEEIYGVDEAMKKKKKLSNSIMGHFVSMETREKLRVAHIGMKHTLETKRKIGFASKGDKNPSKRIDVRKKISDAIRGRKLTKEWKNKIGVSNKGKTSNEKHYCWKGDDASYVAIHMWVRKRKYKPKKCPVCGKSVRLELCNISGKYKRDISDYKYLCVSCHKKFDDGKLFYKKYMFKKHGVDRK